MFVTSENQLSPKDFDQITNNKNLVIILTVILPTLVCLAILIAIVICYRRRTKTIWLKQSENSNRLQSIIVNFSSNSVEPQYSQRKSCISYSQFQRPRTKTIVYNRLTNSMYNSSIQGQKNPAFDDDSLKNDQQPILEISPTKEKPTDSLETEFPASLQVPVPSISSIYLEAIASHHLTLESHSNPPKILLFSQRTEF